MDRFHLIEDAAAILVKGGVYRQAKVFKRGLALYAAHAGGFVRLYRDGTSVPAIRLEWLEVPDGMRVEHDNFGRAWVAR